VLDTFAGDYAIHRRKPAEIIKKMNDAKRQYRRSL
jgi:hypothetical protein